MPKECWVYQAGTVRYETAWEWQKELAIRVARGEIPPFLLLLEHLHTYTIGRRGRPEHILWTKDELARRQIAIYEVDRGGDVTYHGPGQLVGYPIFPLAELGYGTEPSNGQITKYEVIAFVEQLEQILIRTLREFEIPATSRAGMRGVWIPGDPVASTGRDSWRKIASIGVKLTAAGITQHGFALNIDPQMEYWEGLIPCGIPNCKMTSVAELLPSPPSRGRLVQVLITEFERTFQLRMVEIHQLPFDTTSKSHYTIA
ncbi:MAG: lipoyl(octanoyl) transferase LipB [Anaerolineales bacterium]